MFYGVRLTMIKIDPQRGLVFSQPPVYLDANGNSTGSCRAWGSLDLQTSAPVIKINDGFNISSVTRTSDPNSTGKATVNFRFPMPNRYYAVFGSGQKWDDGVDCVNMFHSGGYSNGTIDYNTENYVIVKCFDASNGELRNTPALNFAVVC
jgi:hypothetical protein